MQRELSELGKFRQEFWNHVASRCRDDHVTPGYAGSNVFRRVDEAGLRISQYLAQSGVGIYMVTSHLDAPDRERRVKPYVGRLRNALKDETMNELGSTWLEVDTQDRANWDRMADWLHYRCIIYERVLRETPV